MEMEKKNGRRKYKFMFSAALFGDSHLVYDTHAGERSKTLNIPHGGKLSGEQEKLNPRGWEW